MRSGSYNIVVGIDFSDSSAGAMYHALALAERLSATLHLAHVAPANVTAPTDLGLNVPSEFLDAQQARERLERMRAMIGSKTQVEIHMRLGDPVSGLLQLIHEIHPDMLVVGSHGRSAVMRMLLGSVSSQLARRSTVPVLVVPAPGREEVAAIEPAVVEPPLPSVGQSQNASVSVNVSNDSNSGSVNVAPGGTSGYDVNAELRVRY